MCISAKKAFNLIPHSISLGNSMVFPKTLCYFGMVGMVGLKVVYYILKLEGIFEFWSGSCLVFDPEGYSTKSHSVLVYFDF